MSHRLETKLEEYPPPRNDEAGETQAEAVSTVPVANSQSSGSSVSSVSSVSSPSHITNGVPILGNKLKVAMVHPDMGIGGAERLVTDCALALQDLGHDVVVYTPHCDPQRCFSEVLPRHLGGVVSCVVVNTMIPFTIFGAFQGLCANLRSLITALYVCLNVSDVDVAMCDIVFSPIFIFRLFGIPVLYYCHFPEKLVLKSIDESSAMIMATMKDETKAVLDVVVAERERKANKEQGTPAAQRNISSSKNIVNHLLRALKQLARLVLDWLRTTYRHVMQRLEEIALTYATSIAVNSEFTCEAFKTAFPHYVKGRGEPEIIYPAVHIRPLEFYERAVSMEVMKPYFPDKKDPIVLLSINRYERKKFVHVAVEALAELKKSKELIRDPDIRDRVVLLIAGGYDNRFAENVDYKVFLEDLAKALGVIDSIHFVCNFSSQQHIEYMANCRALLYTPPNEHFGIVPLEAMVAAKAVVATNSGGPTESVADQVTGFLCEPNGDSYAKAIAKLVEGENLAVSMGLKGRERTSKSFSRAALGDTLNSALWRCVEAKAAGKPKHE